MHWRNRNNYEGQTQVTQLLRLTDTYYMELGNWSRKIENFAT